jgi:hypothetical protein
MAIRGDRFEGKGREGDGWMIERCAAFAERDAAAQSRIERLRHGGGNNRKQQSADWRRAMRRSSNSR